MKKATDVVNGESVRQSMTKHAIRNTFRVRDIQSAFRRYASSFFSKICTFKEKRD